MNSVFRVKRGMTEAVVIAALVTGACGRDRTSQGSAGDSIVIGVSLPLTGDFSEPGKGIQRGYEAWVKVVNDGGFIYTAANGGQSMV